MARAERRARKNQPRRRALPIGALVAAAVVVVVIVLIGVNLFGNSQSTATTGDSKSGAPDFTARLLEGGTFNLLEQRGKPVLVLFSASWCSPCIPEVNKMAQLQTEFGARGLRQLVLSVDPTDTAASFAGLRQRTNGSNLLWALDPGQKATVAYGIKATDTKVLIDPGGQIVFQAVGPTPLETLRQQVAAQFGGG